MGHRDVVADLRRTLRIGSTMVGSVLLMALARHLLLGKVVGNA